MQKEYIRAISTTQLAKNMGIDRKYVNSLSFFNKGFFAEGEKMRRGNTMYYEQAAAERFAKAYANGELNLHELQFANEREELDDVIRAAFKVVEDRRARNKLIQKTVDQEIEIARLNAKLERIAELFKGVKL